MTDRLIADRDAFLATAPESDAPVNGRVWTTLRAGDAGPAIVLLPGTLGRADIFFHQIAALRDRARVLALGYPGSGTLEDWAGDIAALARDAGFETAAILGSSLGGYVAQRAAADHPALFTCLVAANTLPAVAGIAGLPPYACDLDATPIDVLRNGFLDGLAPWRARGGIHAELATFLSAEARGRIPEDQMRARLKALKFARPLPPQRLPSAAIRTVESGDDHLIPPPVRAALRAALAPARAFRFETGTHFPYLARPAPYTALIAEVLGLDWPDRWPEGELVTL